MKSIWARVGIDNSPHISDLIMTSTISVATGLLSIVFAFLCVSFAFPLRLCAFAVNGFSE
jgi:hypothetical protein